MQNILPVNYENKFCYNIIIEDNFSKLLENIIRIESNKYQRICIFTDDLVAKHYLDEVVSLFEDKYNQVITYTIINGENSKTLGNIEKLYMELIENHFD